MSQYLSDSNLLQYISLTIKYYFKKRNLFMPRSDNLKPNRCAVFKLKPPIKHFERYHFAQIMTKTVQYYRLRVRDVCHVKPNELLIIYANVYAHDFRKRSCRDDSIRRLSHERFMNRASTM